MMLIPLKSSWIAVFEGVMYIYSFVRGSLIDRIEILLSIALMGIFFGWLTFGKKGPVYQKKRSREFQKKDGEDPGGEKYPPLCSLRTHLRGQPWDGIPLLFQMRRQL